MNKRKICFFLFIVFELLVALGLELLTDSRGPLLGELESQVQAQAQYIFGMATALSVIAAAFLAIKKKQMNPIVRMALVMSGVNMVLLDYYSFFDTNLLTLLALLAIAYMFIWPATED